MPSSRKAWGSRGRARTLFCLPRSTSRDRTLTPNPCSTMEMTALSDTWVVRISGATLCSFSTRRMSLSKPMEGMRNSCPLKNSMGNVSSPSG